MLLGIRHQEKGAAVPAVVSSDAEYETVLLLRNMVGPGEVAQSFA
jgi:hypothetical protein